MSAGRHVLIDPRIDWLLLGGLSLFCSIAFLLAKTPPEIFAPYALSLLLLFSYPHFIASMAVFYSQRGIWKEHPYIALWIPLALTTLLAWIAARGSFSALSLCGQIAVPLLYWHFLKQAYGVGLWMGTAPGKPLSPSRKKLLLLSCTLFGAYGYMGSQRNGGFARIFRISIPSFHVQPWAITLFATLGYASLGLFFAITLWECFRKKESAEFHPRGLIPLLAMATWFDPHLDASPVVFLLPVFHALQYLPFPIRAQVNRPSPRVAIYLVGLVLVGALAFEGLPRASSWLFPNVQAFYVFGAVSLLLNLHHYLIDSVIWRFRDPKVMDRLKAAC